jgi:hypothetical protein
MEWLLILLAGGGAAVGVRKAAAWRSGRREHRSELEAVRRLADEDVVVFGEQLSRLDAAVGPDHLDDEGRVDYQRALDAYESAQRTIGALRSADEVSKVTDTLSTGRYALACVQARVEGRPLPELRTPCFFNPQHGPSVTDVVWTSPRFGTRSVPACAQDAARVAAKQRPEVRTVDLGARRVPYWEAGDAYQPYSSGYLSVGLAVTVQRDMAFRHGIMGGWAAGHFGGGDFGGDMGGGGDGGGF